MAPTRGTETASGQANAISRAMIALLSFATAIIYYFSNPKPQNYYDYTFRVAGRLIGGGIAFSEKPPSWLNEFVPFDGSYYSVFPFGAVVTMVPFALLKTLGIVAEMPGAWIAGLSAGLICFLLLAIAGKYDLARNRQILLAAAILFGTFTWTNLSFAGAWQLALGFAMIGELGAIYFTIYDRRPFIAGLFFALAFGNRTENLLTAPVFVYLLCREEVNRGGAETQSKKGKVLVETRTESELALSNSAPRLRVSAVKIKRAAAFCMVPFVLGVATLIYNYSRFNSFTDFGYARIPGVLQEPWYNHGIFSIRYIGRQAWEMLVKLWLWRDTFPYLVPDGFSSSILFSSPFLFFLLRRGAREKAVKYASFAAILILTFLLWIHGNSGGWQFGYRYAMILLPWIFVILLETAPKRITPVEWVVYSFSFAVNIYATWLFNWTEYMK